MVHSLQSGWTCNSSATQMEQKPEIPEFYRGKTVLITGCTGFIGKVLLWKLLHSCPLIETIYILLRKKHGKEMAERKDELFGCPIFDSFRKSNPKALDKVVAVEGDIGEENIGISEKNKTIILNDVSIVFYNAALLNMNATLTRAINVNTKGAMRMLDIAKEMKKLEALVYVSTAYSYCDQVEVEEKQYPITENPYNIVQLVDLLPEPTLNKITEDIIAPFPNTYIFSKRLTELILEKYEEKLPIIIARPTIVFISAYDPFPGYFDNLNGAIGIAVSTATGILHSMPAHSNKKADLVPVDIVCNSLIVIPWAEAKKKELHLKVSKVPIYNLALAEHDQVLWSEFQRMGKNAATATPFKTILWYPSYDVIQENMFLHNLEIIIYHTIPAFIVDFLLFLVGKKTFMVRLQRKIIQGLKVLRYFTTHQWTFRTDNVMRLKCLMNDADRDIFPVTEKDVNFDELFSQFAAVIKVHYLKEDLHNIGWCKTKLKIFYVIKIISKIIICYLFLELFLKIYSFM